jgi:putative addiction module killer protein
VVIEPIRIEQYQAADGRVPFREWRDSLDMVTKAIVDKRLTRLASGNLGDFKFFDNILELRIDYGPGYRIYCGKKGETWILLLTAGSKRTQSKDIETAKTRWADFQRRNRSKHPF